MNTSLFLLHFRRALHPALGLMLLAAALVAWIGPAQGTRDVVSSGIDSASLARGLLRSDLAFALLVVLVPTLLAGVAHIFARLDHGERQWLLSRPPSRARIALSTWAGLVAGAACWLIAIGLLCELRADGAAESGSGESFRAGQGLEIQDAERDAAGILTWQSESEERKAGCIARLTTGLLGSYNDVQALELSVRHVGREVPFATGQAEAGRHSTVEVILPPGAEPLLFALHARGANRSLVLSQPRLQLFEPMPESMGSFYLLLEVGALLACALALALGLGAWLSPPTTLLLLLGGYGLTWLEADRLDSTWVARWLPGYDLPQAFALVAEGRVPSAMPFEAGLGALALALLGLALHYLALGRWRKDA